MASQMDEKIGEFTEFECVQARFSSSPNLQEKAGRDISDITASKVGSKSPAFA